MEAMVGATAAALTVYDMVKGVERGVRISEVRLLEKRGGRSGHWRATASRTDRKSNPDALRESKGSRTK
jgi:cyclic pyranopterin phosphate synthase